MRIKELRRALPFQGARKRGQANSGGTLGRAPCSFIFILCLFIPDFQRFGPGCSSWEGFPLSLTWKHSASCWGMALRRQASSSQQSDTSAVIQSYSPLAARNVYFTEGNEMLFCWDGSLPPPPLPLPASCLWSQEVKITTTALLWPSAFSNSGHCFLLKPNAAFAAPASFP